MRQGDDHAWRKEWKDAAVCYSKAIQIETSDPDAHINLGVALMNTGRLDESLRMFTRASKLSPDDPASLAGSADVYERMGRLQDAALQYVKVADIYIARRDLDRAIGNWERATQLSPGFVKVHARLAQAYEKIGDKKKAVRAYLTLAANLKRKGDTPNAIKSVERALRLQKNHPQALNMLKSLRSGGEIMIPTVAEPKKQPEPEADPWFTTDDAVEASSDNAMGPLGESMRQAMEILSEFVLSGGSLSQQISYIMQALSHQSQEQYDLAVDAYVQAVKGGIRHPALALGIGGSMIYLKRYDQAIPYLNEVLDTPRLADGALHGLGLCYFHKGQPKEALEYLLKSLHSVEIQMSMNEEETVQLNRIYERLSNALLSAKPDKLSGINRRFIELLTGKDWKQRITETRRMLNDFASDPDLDLVDVIIDSDGEQIAQSVSLIDEYIRRGYLTIAMDEAHRAVEKSSYYLPLHVRMAEIMMKEQRIRQAIEKYTTVAKAYQVRDENDRAAAILGEVLSMAPLDVDVRRSLIHLLEDEKRWDEVLDETINLAATYHQLGDFDTATDTYISAERMAKKIDVPDSKVIEIKHYLADMARLRLNQRYALKLYEDIVSIDPEDEKALRFLVELYFSQNNNVEAIKRLDELLRQYASRRQVNKMIRILEDLVMEHADNMALRSRLAMFYGKLGRREEAIAQLDALGELQLGAGLHSDAAKTIRQIIKMKPDRVEDYYNLLNQLGG
ncbi:hypothetical protein MASR2M15_18210 [Anaerolineales bacterium]